MVDFHARQDYVSPVWAKSLRQPPGGRVKMANLNTPVHPFKAPILTDELGLDMWIKRDDATGFDVSGNKIRKLEFLLAHALAKGATDIVTIGGLQSNHARATAVAAKQLGFNAHLILRHDDPCCDPGFAGNLSLSRLAGASLKLVLPETYTRVGSTPLVNELCQNLQQQQSATIAYGVPVGGSNWIGTWGYLEFVNELQKQFALGKLPDHLVVGCGSGGTCAGIALGVRLARLPIKITAISVCDTPELFYNDIKQIASDLGANMDEIGDPTTWLTIVDGQGEGYGISTQAELDYIVSTANRTGILLDHCYSGKALYAFSKLAKERPHIYQRGSKVLFVHTGGALGTLSRLDQLQTCLPADTVHPLQSRL
eukprot:m.127591 g.127591  ORF g.127591 m.127591 type:complete len:369 (+) comp29286_c0_seq1:281-1387(+)